MRFGTTRGMLWTETLSTDRGAPFEGRTFCRIHILGDQKHTPSVGEIWAAFGHSVDAHAHDSDEFLYVLSGTIEVNGRKLNANDVVFIPGGSIYQARVLSTEGSHVLRIELPKSSGGEHRHEHEYASRAWSGPLTAAGFPDLSTDSTPAQHTE
jgi:mannose-6-phosphate isomerase-like protein (cupin superfamily)